MLAVTRRMRHLSRVSRLLICLLAGSGVDGFELPGLSCTKSPELPLYALARQAKITGEVQVMIKIHDVSRADIDVVSTVHRLLGAAVKSALSRSTFSDICKGETVKLIFDFRMEGAPSVNPLTVYKIEQPNRVVIVSGPGITNF